MERAVERGVRDCAYQDCGSSGAQEETWAPEHCRSRDTRKIWDSGWGEVGYPRGVTCTLFQKDPTRAILEVSRRAAGGCNPNKRR